MSAIKASDETVKLAGKGTVESLGEWCVRNGLATADEIESCLKIQREQAGTATPPPRLGEILVARGILTRQQVAEALAAQKKEIRSCPHCGIQINVATRGDAAAYRCGRCQGLLQAPEGTPPLHAVDEEFILVSKDPIPPEVDRALLDPDSRFGKYVLLRKLGQGGIGVVYLAWDTYLSQFVALKRLRSARPMSPQDTPNEHVQSLLKEARNCIRLRHPGVVSVFDVGRVGREYYVAMEYLEGETLHEKIQAAKRDGLLSPFYADPRTTIEQLIEIARALEYAHKRPSPIIHCDLKPANILIDPEHHAHVLDFGLARNLELDKPTTGEISGTPSYMAPEQASGESEKIDARTDVYAFGAILYELLTGRPPFTGGTLEILGQTIGEEPDRPSDTVRKSRLQRENGSPAAEAPPLRVPPAIEELCMRCLRKDRADRPRSMDEVAAALDVSFKLDLRPAATTEKAESAPGSAPVPPAAPSPHPFPPSPYRSGRSRFVSPAAAILAAIVVVLAGGSALIAYLGSGARQAGLGEARRAEFAKAIASFHPGKAQSVAARFREEVRGTALEGRATMFSEEASWVSRLQNRLVAQLLLGPIECPALAPGKGAGIRVLVVNATPEGLELRRGDRPEFLPWEEIGTTELQSVLETVLARPQDSDLLALGIFCLRSGRPVEAAGYFSRLRGTSLEPIAERYLLSSKD